MVVVKDEKDDRLLPLPIRRQNRLTVKNDRKSQILCQEKCNNPSCDLWRVKSEKLVFLATNAFSDMLRNTWSPTRSRNKGGANGSLAIVKEFIQIGLCISRFLTEKIFTMCTGTVGTKHTVGFSGSTWHQIKIREIKGPSRGITHKCALHERLWKITWGDLESRTMLQLSSVGFGEKYLQAQEFVLVEPVLCSCTVGHITAWCSRHDSDITSLHTDVLGPSRIAWKTILILVHSAFGTRFVSSSTLAW